MRDIASLDELLAQGGFEASEEGRDRLIMSHLADDYAAQRHAVAPPVYLTSLHVYERCEDYFEQDWVNRRGYVYGRCSNPTVALLEEKIAALERAPLALAFGSGMAAFTAALMATCAAGQHIICMRDVYQPIKRFLNGYGIPQLGYRVSYVSGTELAEVEAAICADTRLMILESPASLVFTVVDFPALCALAKAHNIKTYTDNTYCTPLHQKPLELGVDIVMHTMSKYIGGHSDLIGGVLCSKDEALMRRIMTEEREWFGGILGPMEAWLALRGLRTLEVRLKQHEQNAMACAAYLEAHPKVERVLYTGLASHPQAELIARQMRGHCGLMSLVLKGGAERGLRFADGLRLFGKGCSWGGYESLALLPLYKAAAEELDFLGLGEAGRGLVRLHCGLEGKEALLADLEQALAGL